MIVVPDPGLPGSPVAPMAPVAPGLPSGPGTATTAGGVVMTAGGVVTTVGRSHAAKAMAATTAEARMERFMAEIPFNGVEKQRHTLRTNSFAAVALVRLSRCWPRVSWPAASVAIGPQPVRAWVASYKTPVFNRRPPMRCRGPSRPDHRRTHSRS